MRRLIVLYAVCVFGIQYQIKAQSPEAERLLAESITQLKIAEGYSGEFTLKVFFGTELEDEASGTIRFRQKFMDLDLSTYRFVSTEKASWTYLKERNEVQINNVDEDGFSMLHPLNILNSIFEGSYTYEITGQEVLNNTNHTTLSIKPDSPDSEYAKISIQISEDKNLPGRILLVQKDGYRYDIEVNELKRGGGDGKYFFDTGAYPGIVVEDLRL